MILFDLLKNSKWKWNIMELSLIYLLSDIKKQRKLDITKII